MGNKAELDSLSREEAIEMCKKLMKQNADLEKNCNIYLEQLKKNKQKKESLSTLKFNHKESLKACIKDFNSKSLKTLLHK